VLLKPLSLIEEGPGGRRGPKGRHRGRLLLPLLLLMLACSPIRLLKPNQRLLHKVEIKGATQADAERLENLAQQQPNTTLPLPKLAIYQLGHNFYDSTRIKNKMRHLLAHYDERIKAAGTDSAQLGRLLNRRERRIKRKQMALDKGNAIMRLGEPPVLYDSALTRKSVEQMTTYLHSEGFFRASVYATDTARSKRGLWRGFLYGVGLRKEQPRVDSTGKVRPRRRVTVTYHVSEGRPFIISELTQTIPDSGLARIVHQGMGSSLVKKGDRYREELIGQERSRLEAQLKNAGYYEFRQQYITLEADTSFQPYTVRLRTLIANPAPGQGHRRYTLRRVRMLTDVGVNRTLQASTGDTLRRAGVPGQAPRPRRLGLRTDTVTVDSVQFAAYKLRYSPNVLVRKITLRPGQYYSQERTQRTQRLLADLDMFRFNTVSYRKVPDPVASDSAGRHPSTGQLDAIINATPADKYQITDEFGGTFVANLPGPFINVRLKTRNPFGGAEVLEVSARAGFEGQFLQASTSTAVSSESIYTTQVGATVSLVLPQLFVPFRTNHFLTRYNPRTRFSLSETFVKRPEYQRSNFELTYDYIWQKSAYHTYVFSPFVLNLINTPFVSDTFRARLERLRNDYGSPLYRSFAKLLVPSFSFSSLYNSNDINQTRDAHYLRVVAELGGLTRDLYRFQLEKATRSDPRKENSGLQVYDFARLSVDYRRYHHLTPRTYFVWRLNGGAVHALTRTLGVYTVPYDKSFFAGGSTSIRAWQPRRLGPGGYTSFRTISVNGEKQEVRDYVNEQPGELLLEGSGEYRFPIYSFINGAFFTDFGNVWSIEEPGTTEQPDGREGAQFRFNRFYKQIAVGSGFGLRFDFSFLVLRLDMAVKVFDPTAEHDQRWALKNFDTSANPVAFNLGIGYPW
jgi:outer membrane protein assembly factor BamA